jgi:hypothetical protein
MTLHGATIQEITHRVAPPHRDRARATITIIIIEVEIIIIRALLCRKEATAIVE